MVFLSASVCIIIGAIVQLVSLRSNVPFLIGRVLIGLRGQFTATYLIYIGEVAASEFRGVALMMFQFMQCISQLAVSCIDQGTESVDSALSYYIAMGLLIVLPGIMLTFLRFIPESSTWLLIKVDVMMLKSLFERSTVPPSYDSAAGSKTIVHQVKLEKERGR